MCTFTTFIMILNSESESMMNGNNIDIGLLEHRLLFKHYKKNKNRDWNTKYCKAL